MMLTWATRVAPADAQLAVPQHGCGFERLHCIKCAAAQNADYGVLQLARALRGYDCCPPTSSYLRSMQQLAVATVIAEQQR